jgi:hypothetical protein
MRGHHVGGVGGQGQQRCAKQGKNPFHLFSDL